MGAAPWLDFCSDCGGSGGKRPPGRLRDSRAAGYFASIFTFTSFAGSFACQERT